VRPVVEEVIALMAGLVGKGVDLVAEIADHAVVVMPPGELDRVLVNLIVNARDAVDGRGRIVVSVDVTPHSRFGTAEAVVIEVRDDGVGMKPDILSRALEPSFTTKPAGEGSGIGLAAAATIVRGAGGEIELHSTPGVGTTVRVSLPVADAR
jgi:two-component system cell cycle sensor histidine kinase/response regulator CckA